MNILDSLYENKITFPNLLDRKMKISDPYTFVYGPKLCGKTSLIFNYLKEQEKNYLYIDLDDFRFEKEDLDTLQYFIDIHDIEICVIENFTEDFTIPKVKSLILSNSYPLHKEHFSLLLVMPLDFEEFLLFDTKHQNTTNSFNSFLKYGNIPEIIEYKEYKKTMRNKELIKLYSTNNTAIKILQSFIHASGETKSLFWLYTSLKKNTKLSKDLFYRTVKELEMSHTILFCEKFNQPKATKKIFCFNYALIELVSNKKNFTNLFTNMVYLGLYRQNEQIFYLDYIDFYIPANNTIILSIPFYNTTILGKFMQKILHYIDMYVIQKITIVTISTTDSLYIDTIEAEIRPFYEWALEKE